MNTGDVTVSGNADTIQIANITLSNMDGAAAGDFVVLIIARPTYGTHAADLYFLGGIFEYTTT